MSDIVAADRVTATGVRSLSMRLIADAGIAPLSRGDRMTMPFAESVMGLFKTEVIRRQGPWQHPRDRQTLQRCLTFSQ